MLVKYILNNTAEDGAWSTCTQEQLVWNPSYTAARKESALLMQGAATLDVTLAGVFNVSVSGGFVLLSRC